MTASFIRRLRRNACCCFCRWHRSDCVTPVQLIDFNSSFRAEIWKAVGYQWWRGRGDSISVPIWIVSFELQFLLVHKIYKTFAHRYNLAEAARINLIDICGSKVFDLIPVVKVQVFWYRMASKFSKRNQPNVRNQMRSRTSVLIEACAHLVASIGHEVAFFEF